MAQEAVYRVGKRFPNRLFVGGLPVWATAPQLAEFFKSYGIGNVVEAKIIVDESGLSKGYGFVTFDSENSATAVSNMDVIFFGNKKLNIGPAVKKKGPDVHPVTVVVPPAPWPFTGQDFRKHSPPTYRCAAEQTYCNTSFHGAFQVSAPATVYPAPPVNTIYVYPTTETNTVNYPAARNFQSCYNYPSAQVAGTVVAAKPKIKGRRKRSHFKSKIELAPRFQNNETS